MPEMEYGQQAIAAQDAAAAARAAELRMNEERGLFPEAAKAAEKAEKDALKTASKEEKDAAKAADKEEKAVAKAEKAADKAADEADEADEAADEAGEMAELFGDAPAATLDEPMLDPAAIAAAEATEERKLDQPA